MKSVHYNYNIYFNVLVLYFEYFNYLIYNYLQIGSQSLNNKKVCTATFILI